MTVIKFLQIGTRSIATSTCKTRAADRATWKVQPKVARALVRLSITQVREAWKRPKRSMSVDFAHSLVYSIPPASIQRWLR